MLCCLSKGGIWLLRAEKVLQGTLDLLFCKPCMPWARCTAMALLSASSRSPRTCSAEQGTLYPALLRLEQRGWITSKWGASENNRKAKFTR